MYDCSIWKLGLGIIFGGFSFFKKKIFLINDLIRVVLPEPKSPLINIISESTICLAKLDEKFSSSNNVTILSSVKLII